MSDLSTVLSAQLLTLYGTPFKPSGYSASKISKIMQAKITHTKELIGNGLIEMGVSITQHLDNIALAEKTIYTLYESREIETTGFSVADFARIFFKNQTHKEYKILLSKLKLNTL